MAKKRITLILDSDKDQDVIEYFKDKPITETGVRLIRAGLFLDKAHMIDSLLLMEDKDWTRDLDGLSLLKKAIEIAEIMQAPPSATLQETQDTAPPKKKRVFS